MKYLVIVYDWKLLRCRSNPITVLIIVRIRKTDKSFSDKIVTMSKRLMPYVLSISIDRNILYLLKATIMKLRGTRLLRLILSMLQILEQLLTVLHCTFCGLIISVECFISLNINSFISLSSKYQFLFAIHFLLKKRIQMM